MMNNHTKIILSLMILISFFMIAVAVPDPPSSVSANDVPNDDGGAINITWTLSDDDGTNVTGYDILRSEGGSYLSLAIIASGSTFYVDPSTIDGTPYNYIVSAKDGTNYSNSSIVGPVTSSDNLAPIITGVDNISITDSSATIIWNTHEDSDSRVDYGIAPSTYTLSETSSSLVSSHSLVLTDLTPSTLYYYQVTSEDDSGKPNSSSEFTFTTTSDTNPPTVLSTDPTSGETGVPLTANVIANFSEDMNDTTISTSSFLLSDLSGPIAGTVTYDSRTVTFNPTQNFNFSTVYTATITTAVTDEAGNNLSSDKVWSFTSAANQGPSLSDATVSPENGITPVSFEFHVTYTDVENESATFVKVHIGTDAYPMNETEPSDTTTSDGKEYEFNITISDVGEYDCYFEASDGLTTSTEDSDPETITVNSATYETGNRIWDENEGLSTKYTWDAWSFGGFYYDVDSNEGGETLTITDIDWSLSKGDVVYTAKPIPVKFERTAFGEYYVIGFMAERYFAGYKSGSIGDSGDNLLDDDKLSKVLMDDDRSQMVKAGQALTLEEGYEFRILELDIQGNQALVGLFKDDWKVEEDILSGGDTLVYKVDGIPIIGIHINSVFAGMETSSIRVDGIFQISDEFTSVNNGEKFGLMTIDTVSSNEIIMENRDSISLSKHKGESFNLMGKINIEVGDSNDLRFAPVVDTSEPGTYELRGTVTEEEDPIWTPLNFEGLLYDMDSGFGSESLSILRDNTGDRSISSGDLEYTSKPISVNFEHNEDGWGSYQAIGFMGEKYFAGYTKNSFLSSDRSLIGEERLGKILVDEDKKYTLRLGNPLTLQEGYSLQIADISRNGDLVMIAVYKDGDELATDILGSDESFVYDVEVDGTDIPLIVVHIQSVFTGFETSSVFFDGLFQISEDFVTVENGDTYGKMEVTTANENEISMENKDSFSLASGETINIMGDIKIKVADSSTVRFYPFLEVIVEEPEYLELEIPESVFQEEEITMIVTSDGDEIEDATITFGDIEIGETDSNGELTYTPAETGTFTVTASKSGYESISGEIEVLYQPKALEISAPLVVDKGEEITISITSEGDKINGASVKFGSIDLGTTPSSGNITYTPENAGTFTIQVSKSGYQDASKDIDVTDPAAKLVFTNLTIEPRIVQPGQIVNITAEAANFGTIRDSDTAILKINGKTEDTRELLLDPGESVTLSFTANKTKAGTYRVELNEKTGTFKVAGEGLGSITGIVIGIIVLLAATAVIYSVYTGTLTTEVVTAKAEEIKKQLKQLFEK